MPALLPINVTNTVAIGIDFTEIYRPNDWFNGYISDLMFSAKLPSFAEYKRPDSESKFANRDERLEQLRNYGATHPHVYLSLYSARKDSPEQRERMGTIRLWNLLPEYKNSIFPYISRAAQIILQNDEIWSARVEDAGHGLPKDNDEVKLRVAGFELPMGEATRDRPIWYSLTLEQTNVEYPLVLPNQTTRYSIKARGASGDPQGTIRYAFEPGIVTATSGYDVIPFSNEEADQGLNLTGQKIYFATETANLPIIVKVWV